jgi:hypothetical protein
MPCNYTIYKDKGLVVTTALEVFTFAEAVAHEDKIYGDPDFDPTFVHLIDATGITRAELTASEISILARRTRFSSKARKALVVNTALLFGLARMFETYLQLSGAAEHVSVFKERHEALTWLGITGDV